MQDIRQVLYFEDLEEGYTIETVGRTVTETDVVQFAALSGDYNPLHTDAVYAATTPFGERIAHGLLGLAIATGLVNRLGAFEGSVEAFTGLDWKYRAPIKIGDTIHVRVTIARKRAVPGYAGGIVNLDVIILNQRDETVQKGVWSVMLRGRSAAA